jgi:Ni,Fe-hydrogenase maturation factor
VDRLDQLPGGAPAKLTRQRADVVVFACGDPAHAEHDSVAIAACKDLPADVLERIDLKITGPLRPEYLRDLAPGTFVIVADTAPGTPGEIVEIPFGELVGREEPLQASSTPEGPLDEVVAMAELLRDEPVRGRFVGLGVESVDLTAPPDREATERLRAAVLDAIAEGSSPA